MPEIETRRIMRRPEDLYIKSDQTTLCIGRGDLPVGFCAAHVRRFGEASDVKNGGHCNERDSLRETINHTGREEPC